MATAQDKSEFVIEVKADRLLNNLSNNIGEIVLKLAANITERKTSAGVPMVTVADIEKSANVICKMIGEGIERGQLPVEAQPAFDEFQEFCKHLAETTRAAHGADRVTSTNE